MAKRIVSVGFDIPGTDVDSFHLKSNDSILDADIVIFSPAFSKYQADKEYAGQPLLSESDSDQLRQHTAHWKSELRLILEHGKTIFLPLCELGNFHIHSGQQNVTGTGRSTRVAKVVHPYDAYSAVPFDGLVGTVHQSTGDRIKQTEKICSLL